MGKVGSGVGESSGVGAGTTVASRVDKIRPGDVHVRSEFFQEAGCELGGKVSGG